MGGQMAAAYLLLGASPIVIPVLMLAGVVLVGIVTLIASAFGLK